jgi:hypothetical protein
VGLTVVSNGWIAYNPQVDADLSATPKNVRIDVLRRICHCKAGTQGGRLPVFGVMLAVGLTTGCAPAAKPQAAASSVPAPPPAPPPVGGSPAPNASTAAAPAGDFQQLLATAVQELQAKNEAHKSWGLGSFDRWDLDQDAGTLVFTNSDGSTVTTTAQIIGSFSTRDNSWLWAWDNPSIDDKLKADALKLKAYGQEHAIEKLTSRKWTGTEEDAWAMAALAVKLAGAEGAYRGPSGNSFVFITFRDSQATKAGAGP